MSNVKQITMYNEGFHITCTLEKCYEFKNAAYMKYDGYSFGIINFNIYKLVYIDKLQGGLSYDLVEASNKMKK